MLDLPHGTVLGNYRLEGQLGRGGMGVVYRAIQLSMDRPVAVKVLHPHRVRDEKAVQDFITEARITAGFDHSGIVRVYEVGRVRDNLLFFSMELVMGRTLATLVQQQGPLAWPQARNLVLQIADALAHAHRRGVVHRDLKPGNVLLDANGQVHVTDLGLAMDRFAGRTAELGRRTLSLVGTAEWSAPEQLRNPQRATPAADVFALGATAYWLLTGQEPFAGEGLLDLVIAVAVDEPPLLARLPSPARGILERMLAKDPAQRPADGNAVLTLLGANDTRESGRRKAAVSVRTDQIVPPRTTRARRRRR